MKPYGPPHGVAARTLDGVEPLHRTIDRIIAGDLHVRLPIKGAGDDLDSLAAKINQMLDEMLSLMEEVRSVGDFIAHDLRTPLTAMCMRLERGLSNGQPDRLHQIVRQSLSDLERSLATIASLLRLAEIENGRRLSFASNTDLVEIARDVHELYEPLAEAKAIDFALIDRAPMWVEADRDMLIEAVANLVDNAIKFIPPGGAVQIEITEQAGCSVVRITDSGPGIPPAERCKVAQRFYRPHRSASVRGNGLGLSLVAAIAKLHGFRLQIEEVDRGASVGLVCTPQPDTSL